MRKSNDHSKRDGGNVEKEASDRTDDQKIFQHLEEARGGKKSTVRRKKKAYSWVRESLFVHGNRHLSRLQK